MQSRDPLDSSKNKRLFTKKIHRPWDPSSLENKADEPVLHAVEAENQNPAALKAETKISIGGFLAPHHVLTGSAPEPLSKAPEKPSLEHPLKTEDQKLENLLKNLNRVKKEIEVKERVFQEEAVLKKEIDSKVQQILEQTYLEKQQTQQMINTKIIELESKVKKAELKANEAEMNAKEKIDYLLKEYLSEKQKFMETAALERQQALQDANQKIAALELASKEVELKIQSIHQEHATEKEKMQLEIIGKEKQAELKNWLSVKDLQEKMNEKSKIMHQEFEQKEKILRENAAEKLKQGQETLEEKEKALQSKTAEKLKEIQKEFEEKEKRLQEKTNEKIKQLESKTDQKIEQLEIEANRKVKEAREQAEFHEKAKIVAQTWIQKHLETARQAEVAKNELKIKLETLTHKLAEQETTFKRKNENLQGFIDQLEKQQAGAEEEKILLSTQISDSLDMIKKMEAVILTERNLRKIVEQKFRNPSFLEEEARRKLLESKIIELERKKTDIELKNKQLEKKLTDSMENLTLLETTLEAEKKIKAGLDTQIQELTTKTRTQENTLQEEAEAKALLDKKLFFLNNERGVLEEVSRKNQAKIRELLHKIHKLEQAKQFETESKESSDKKVSLLTSDKRVLEQKNLDNEDKIKDLGHQIHELKKMVQSEVEMKKVAEQKISMLELEKHNEQQTFEHANKALQNEKQALEQQIIQNGEKIKDLHYQVDELKALLQNEVAMKKTIEQKIADLKIEQQNEQQAFEKICYEHQDKIKELLNQISELNQTIQQEAETKQTIEQRIVELTTEKQIVEHSNFEYKRKTEELLNKVSELNNIIQYESEIKQTTKEKNLLLETEKRMIEQENIEHKEKVKNLLTEVSELNQVIELELATKQTIEQKILQLEIEKQASEQANLEYKEKTKNLLYQICDLQKAVQQEVTAKQTIEQKIVELENEKANEIKKLEIKELEHQYEVKDFMYQISDLKKTVQNDFETQQSHEEKMRLLAEQVDNWETLCLSQAKEKETLEQKVVALQQEMQKQQQRLEHVNLEIINRNKELINEVFQLKQSHVEQKETRMEAERKLSDLYKTKQILEKALQEHERKSEELQLLLSEEKALRIEAEHKRVLENKARLAAEEKINDAIEEANKTVLNFLENLNPQ